MPFSDYEFNQQLVSGTLAEISREAIGKLLRRANPRRTSGIRKQDTCSQQCESTGLVSPFNLKFLVYMFY